mmetsp:Transcript_38135/g.37639  ORF Transcript_38135/g.37639 Transcript_38135/m.37639 type:complete len:390 (+) Transcript_38135:30-1199(+)
MFSVKNVRSARRFSSLARIPSARKFSIIENSSVKSGISVLPIYKNGHKINIEVNQTKMQERYSPKVNSKLGSELCFTRDKAFIKYLTSIHLRSKDKETISAARLLAYFITQKVKPEDEPTDDETFQDTMDKAINQEALGELNVNPDVLNGVARGLSHILDFIKKNSRKIHDDKSLILKAGSLYCRGNHDISQVIDFVNFGETVRTLIVTKDVSGTKNESSLAMYDSLALDVGHSSFHFVNDQLNYRYESSRPIIVLTENLDEYLAKSVLSQLEGLANGIVFVTKDADSATIDLLQAKKKESGLALSVVNLSEEDNEDSESFEILKDNLNNLGEQSFDGDYYLKTCERVIMDDVSTLFIDKKLKRPSDGSNSEYFQEIVEVNLQSPDETW